MAKLSTTDIYGSLTVSGNITGTLKGNADSATNATYATKIGTNANHPAIGSTTQPVYVNSSGVITAGTALGSMAYKEISDYLASTTRGAANGVASLDDSGLVPSSQLPSYVDDVLEHPAKSSFPPTGESGKIYVDTSSNLTYRWSGSAYVEISPSLALGETSSTAYAGDKGATLATNLSSHTSNTTVHITSNERTSWNGKYAKPSSGIPKTDLASAVQTSLGKADTALQSHQDISGKENTSNKVKSWSSTTTDDHYPSEKLVKDALDKKSDTTHTHNYAGSSSAGGSATSAVALTSKSIGNSTKPVYFDANGKPVAISYTIGASVPSGAVFTDSHYTAVPVLGASDSKANATTSNDATYLNIIENDAKSGGIQIKGSGATTVSATNGVLTINSPSTMTGATSSANGTSGLVPAPAKGEETYFLRGDGTWVVPTDTNTTYKVASGDDNGQIKVTPSSGSAYNVSVKGLGSNAYSSTSYLPIAGGTITGTTDSTSTSTGALIVKGGLGVAGSIYGGAVYGAVWNDLADAIPLGEGDIVEAGYCYGFDGEHYTKTSEYMQQSYIGIHSDTYGFKMGIEEGKEKLDVAVSGFVLAYVDKEYLVGTPLTCTEGGILTEIKHKDKVEYPEMVIATYWKSEPNDEWGTDTRKVKVNGRKWVKIK